MYTIVTATQVDSAWPTLHAISRVPAKAGGKQAHYTMHQRHTCGLNGELRAKEMEISADLCGLIRTVLFLFH